jgi:histidinol-phosphate/aromatic aminotransferase/cobyric acid decarboxylase-like protein
VICDPNNPTGARLSTTMWRAVLDVAGEATLLVDESFAVFAPEQGGPPEDERIVSVRSLTKLYATPGVRAGFLIAAPPRLLRIRDARDPWAVGSHALAAAAAGGWGISARDRLRIASRRRALLETLDLPEVPGSDRLPCALVHLPQAAAVATSLADQRIAVRSCASFGLPDHLRIGIPHPSQLTQVTTALGKARSALR